MNGSKVKGLDERDLKSSKEELSYLRRNRSNEYVKNCNANGECFIKTYISIRKNRKQ